MVARPFAAFAFGSCESGVHLRVKLYYYRKAVGLAVVSCISRNHLLSPPSSSRGVRACMISLRMRLHSVPAWPWHRRPPTVL